jgi:inhibitor of cysteine peptidase
MKRMRVQNIILVSILLFSCGFWGCSRKSEANLIVPRYTDTGGTIQAGVNETFMIVLPANPTTGYRWVLEEPVKNTVVQLFSSSYWEPMPPVPGKGGEDRRTFRGTGTGSTAIKLIYIRPWEPKKVEKRVTYEVTVQ